MKRMYRRLWWAIVAALLIAALYELFTQSWSDLFVVSQAVVLSVLPHIMQRKYNVYTPDAVRLGIVAFLFATLFLGEVNKFYENYFWWDVALHTFAGVGSTLIAYILLVITYRKSELRSTPFMTSVLAFSLTMTIAVLWEVYEFIIDLVWAPTPAMQLSNVDTMTDFLVTVLGASLVTLFGYRYLVGTEREGVIADVIEDGRRKNVEVMQRS